ncbi:MAG: hypothetical protein LUP94_03955 [Candidatus Methanomethylicus sp.]|nr:hypothetical protein [Candidatus Methanomethylicus sp.]
MKPARKARGKIIVDLPALIREAKLSEDREAYRTLEACSSYRLGVVARIGSDGQEAVLLELLLLPGGREVDIESMEKKIAAIRRLQESGYDISNEEDGSISCEMAVTASDLGETYGKVSDILAKLYDEGCR